jgi:hypothetical protein
MRMRPSGFVLSNNGCLRIGFRRDSIPCETTTTTTPPSSSSSTPPGSLSDFISYHARTRHAFTPLSSIFTCSTTTTSFSIFLLNDFVL